jgi:uncharacterized protein (DUF2267 family)
MGDRSPRVECRRFAGTTGRSARSPRATALRRRSTRARLEQFLELIAEREGVQPSVAREHAEAVLATLREPIDDEEWRDLVAQLPREYSELF